jgi:hypothetical protein
VVLAILFFLNPRGPPAFESWSYLIQTLQHCPSANTAKYHI